MTDKKQESKKKGGVHPVVAGITGVLVGAGVVTAGAVAFKDEKNRKKAKDAFTKAKAQAVGGMKKLQKQVRNKEGEDTLNESKEQIEKALD